MKVELIFITHNRLAYTELSLPALLSDSQEEFSLIIWDNASTDGTQNYLSTIQDPRISEKIFSKDNLGLRGAVNYLFEHSTADLLGIVPNDLLVSAGWTRTLVQAHADVPEFGLLGCWHLGEEYYDESRAKHKIQRFGEHQVLRHPWTGGAGGLVKLKAVKACGFLKNNSTPDYWKSMAMKGYVNGYYLPLVFVEHMDYPWSKYYAFSDKIEEGLKTSVTYNKRGINTVAEAKKWHQEVLRNILDEPYDVKYYVGWRKKLRRGRNKLAGMFKDFRFGKQS